MREPDAARDVVAELMMVAPDGRTKVLGDVGAKDVVWDISPDARTVLTSRHTDDTLTLTVWDVATGTSENLDVSDPQDAILVEDGVLVIRNVTRAEAGERTGVYGLSGKLLRNLGDLPLTVPVASGDGSMVAAVEDDKVTVRDTKTGAVKHTIDPPEGDCYPGFQYGPSSFAVHCATGTGAGDEKSVAYTASYEGGGTPRRVLADDDGGIQSMRRVAGGSTVYGRGVESGCPVPMRAHGGRADQIHPSGATIKPAQNAMRVAGAYDSTVVLAGDGGCRERAGLLRKDLKTGKVTHLIGPKAEVKGYVTSAWTADGT